MASPVTPALVYRRRSRALRILFASAGVGLVLALVIFFGEGRWLVVEDRLAKARAIVVLSGAMPMRAVEAAKLYREGYAPEIWLTHPTEPAETLERMGIPFAGEDHYNTLVLIHEGVPAQAIRVLEPPIVNTADEIKVAASALALAKGAAVILSRQKLTRAAALVAKPERCSRCSARSFGSVKRLGRPAPASGAMILDFEGKEK
jgi:uncharacterized SAM-binding protein YcdF (DUF218 family)